MKCLISAMSLVVFAGSAWAVDTNPQQAAMKKVVDQFNGRWKVEITASVPGETQKLKFPGTIDCRPVALSSGVGCTIQGKSDKLGTMIEECLIAHDPEGTGVHLMCVTNAGEVHDHKGKWSDEKSLSFEPLKTTSEGKPAVEDLSFVWQDAKHMTARSVTTVGDQKMDFEFVAVKR